MRQKTYRIILVFLALSLALGCGGPLRYSQVSPDAAEFHPESIAVLSVSAGAFPEAQGKVEGILARALAKKKWLKKVIQPEQLAAAVEKDPALKKDIADYLEKLRTVSFSDPDISKRIGDALGIQTFMVGQVELWHYAEVGDKKQATVAFELKLVNTDTGKILWRVNHSKVEEYMLLKPGLLGMAENLADEMIDRMPH